LKIQVFSDVSLWYWANTWSDNKVRELATVGKALVWFDDVDVSTFHSYVVVDLCRRENVGA